MTQTIEADAIATGIQDSTIDQSDTVEGGTAPRDRRHQRRRDAGAPPHGETGDAAHLAADATGEPTPRPSEPVDGSVVVDSAGDILGILDSATGNVVAPDGTIVGTLNEATGVVVDSAGNLIGTVTDLVDGATVAGADGEVLGVLDAATGNVARRHRQRRRRPRPADRRGPQHGRRGGRHGDRPRRRHHRARLRRQRRSGSSTARPATSSTPPAT